MDPPTRRRRGAGLPSRASRRPAPVDEAKGPTPSRLRPRPSFCPPAPPPTPQPRTGGRSNVPAGRVVGEGAVSGVEGRSFWVVDPPRRPLVTDAESSVAGTLSTPGRRSLPDAPASQIRPPRGGRGPEPTVLPCHRRFWKREGEIRRGVRLKGVWSARRESDPSRPRRRGGPPSQASSPRDPRPSTPTPPGRPASPPSPSPSSLTVQYPGRPALALQRAAPGLRAGAGALIPERGSLTSWGRGSQSGKVPHGRNDLNFRTVPFA